jgi:hypothetical protein
LQFSGPDPRGRGGDRRGESGNRQVGVGVADPTGTDDARCSAGDRPPAGLLASLPIRVRKVVPPTLPINTSGTIATETSLSSNPSETNASGPLPLTPTESVTCIRAVISSNHCWILAAASGPAALNRSCTPQPTNPCPPRTKHRPPVGRIKAASSAAGDFSSRVSAVTCSRVVGTAVTSAKTSRQPAPNCPAAT